MLINNLVNEIQVVNTAIMSTHLVEKYYAIYIYTSILPQININ